MVTKLWWYIKRWLLTQLAKTFGCYDMMPVKVHYSDGTVQWERYNGIRWVKCDAPPYKLIGGVYYPNTDFSGFIRKF